MNVPRIRQRGREFVYPHSLVTYTDRNGTPTTKILGCPTYRPHWEYMSDNIKKWQSDFNPCYHYKLINAGKPCSSLAVEVDPGVYEYYSSDDGGIMTADILEACRNVDLGISAWLDDFGANALNHFTHAVMPDNTSLLNFIIELIELIEGNVGILKKLEAKWLKAVEIFNRMLARGDSYWLAFNFALKPTIGDLQNMLTVIERASKRIKWLADYNHKVIRLHYRESPRTFSGVLDTDVQWYFRVAGGDPLNFPIPPGLHGQITYNTDLVLSAWADVRFNIPDWLLADWEAVGIAVLQMMGVYNPAKVVWEATPFTWLGEWFLNQRARLEKEKLSLAPYPPPEILGMGHTLHYKKWFGESKLLVDGPSGTLETVLGPYSLDLYDRRPGLPTGDPAVRPPVLNEWQTSIIAALASTRGRSHFRRR